MPVLTLRHVPDSAPAMPTLLVNGRDERAFQPFRKELARMWPFLCIVDLDGGHSVNVENPQGFSSALVEFLAEHRHLD